MRCAQDAHKENTMGITKGRHYLYIVIYKYNYKQL